MERRKFTREFKLEAVRLIKDRGVSYVQASQDLNVHPSQLRDWVKKLSEDPQHAFPGHGQMKPEQLEIVRLKREVAKLKAERDIQRASYCQHRGRRGMIHHVPVDRTDRMRGHSSVLGGLDLTVIGRSREVFGSQAFDCYCRAQNQRQP
jgi:transposase